MKNNYHKNRIIVLQNFNLFVKAFLVCDTVSNSSFLKKYINKKL